MVHPAIDPIPEVVASLRQRVYSILRGEALRQIFEPIGGLLALEHFMSEAEQFEEAIGGAVLLDRSIYGERSNVSRIAGVISAS